MTSRWFRGDEFERTGRRSNDLDPVTELSDTSDNFTVFGSSLVTVFRDLIVDYIALMECAIAMGLGPYEYDEVDEIRGHLAGIEALERDVREAQKVP